MYCTLLYLPLFSRISSIVTKFGSMKKSCAVTVACHVIPASGKLVDVDIRDLSESPWPGSDIF